MVDPTSGVVEAVDSAKGGISPVSVLLFLSLALGCAVPFFSGCSGHAVEAGGVGAGSGSVESGGAAGAPPVAGSGGSTPLREPKVHRATETPCDQTRPSNYPDAPAGNPSGFVDCHAHTDCTQGENGRCIGNNHDGWRCTYDACFSDADCAGTPTGGTQLCGCEEAFRSDNNVCLSADCRLDADCGPGGYCSPSLGECGTYDKHVGYFCHTQEDECTDDSECTGGVASYPAYCAFMPAIGHWRCSNDQCAG